MNKKKIKEIRDQIKFFESMLENVDKRIDAEINDYWRRDQNLKDFDISGFKEAAVLKSSFKVMKYNIDKIL